MTDASSAESLDNRRFLGRAVDFVARAGITQFLDLGAGRPGIGDTHRVAQRVRPEARVTYVDSDPVAAAKARASLADGDDESLCVVHEDVRDPIQVLEHPDVAGLIDFEQPLAVLLVALLHEVADDEDPGNLVRAFGEVMAPGSYPVLSHPADDEPAGEHRRPVSRPHRRRRLLRRLRPGRTGPDGDHPVASGRQ